ncbi:hypothetical protein BH10ACT1_BH10ACT1_30940 [soil metagenome]
MATTHRQADAGLRHAAWGFLGAAILHNGDHFRRGIDTVSAELFWVGNLGMVVSAVAIHLVLSGHRSASLVAVSAGFPLAIGFTAAHWLPTWSALSDTFVDGGVSWLSIVASLLEIAGALWLGIAGLRALRHQGGLASAAW